MNDRADDEHRLLFAVRRSVRYHDRRTTHYERLHHLTNLITILLAGVVLMELARSDSPQWIRILAALGALLGATDLIVGYSRRADAHRNFKRQFTMLERNVLGGQGLDASRAERLSIEAEEPPTFRALDLLCHNDECYAMGHRPTTEPEDFARVPWYMRLTANWYRWPNAAHSSLAKAKPSR